MENTFETKTLHASGAETATGTGSSVSGFGFFDVFEFQLDVTAAATQSSDTFDAYVQTTLDGTNWIDVVHFTQVLGNGGAKRFVAKISSELAESMFSTATALSAGSIRHIVGDQFRAYWAITDASTADASFTFSLTAHCR